MSEKAIGFAAGLALKILLRKLRKQREYVQETVPEKLTKEEITQYIVDTTIDQTYDQLLAEYDRAYENLLKKEKEIEDPYIKNLIKNLKEYHELFRPKERLRPGWILLTILLNEALEKGVRDREKIYQYILKNSWDFGKQIAEILPEKEYRGNKTQRAEEVRNPYWTLIDPIFTMINEVNENDPVWQKYAQLLRNFGKKN